jgi:hypothetical protein
VVAGAIELIRFANPTGLSLSPPPSAPPLTVFFWLKAHLEAILLNVPPQLPMCATKVGQPVLMVLGQNVGPGFPFMDERKLSAGEDHDQHRQATASIPLNTP